MHKTDKSKSSITYRYEKTLQEPTPELESSEGDMDNKTPSSTALSKLKASLVSEMTHLFSNSLTSGEKASNAGAAHKQQWQEVSIGLDAALDEGSSVHQTGMILLTQALLSFLKSLGRCQQVFWPI
jgi:hypothetical protein